MSAEYEDIIHMPHHVSAKRSRMPMPDRAAQFSPFAALTGYDAAIRESGRLTDTAVELDVDAQEMLNRKLQALARRLAERPEVIVTYFIPDERKSGGAYEVVTGRLQKIDLYQRAILLEGGIWILLDSIYDIRQKRNDSTR